MDNGTAEAQVAATARSPQVVSASARALLEAGVPEHTRRAYSADRREWAAFAAVRGEPPIPVRSDVLVEYVAELLTVGSPVAAPGRRRPLTAASVERRLSAISTWSVEQGHGRPDLRAARLALRGHRRTSPARTRQAAPVTVAVLRALVAQADCHHSPDGTPTARGLRDRTLLLLGFALGARRSELVRLDICDLHQAPEGLRVGVRRTKTTDHVVEVAVPWAADPLLCPVRSALGYRHALVGRGVSDGALFRRVTRTDAVLAGRLSPESVADVVARLAVAASVAVPDGFSGYSGHSLRRGFATEARRAGADQVRIARQGGWADNSTALARYLADVDRWTAHPLQGVL